MPQRKLNVYWLDDDTSRFSDYIPILEDFSLEFELRFAVRPIEVTHTITEVVQSWVESPLKDAPDLFIVDHSYRASGETYPFKLNGNTLTHLIRRVYNNVPIVAVSALQTVHESNEYCAVFRYEELDRYLDQLFCIARDYGALKEIDFTRLCEVLNLPKPEVDVFRMAVPMELISAQTPTSHSQLVKWIRNYLLQVPGYVFDDLHAATFLGLSVAGFRKVSDKFQEALYTGPFATSTRPLWWQTELSNCLHSLLEENSPDNPQVGGRMLPGVSHEDYCACYVSNEVDACDFVVAEAHPSGELKVVRKRYSRPLSVSDYLPPGFDARLRISAE